MLLDMTGIRKAFGNNLVLDDVGFAIDAGEIVALLGANGAGKSTLMKIMTGIYSRDAGTVCIDGETVRIEAPRDAMAHGIRLIPQELSVLPDLSVAENVFLGAMPANGDGPLATVRFAEMVRRAQDLLEELGLGDIDARARLSRLTLSEQRLVEIARALAGKARVLVMDEPTASLSEPERDKLFAIMAGLRQAGTAIVFISHYLDEVFEVSDRISVLRDGINAGVFVTAETDHDSVLAAMLGRQMEHLYPPPAIAPGAPFFVARDIADGDTLAGISITARQREIHGVFGLIGSGVQTIGKALFGAHALTGGTITLNGTPFRPRFAADAIASGVGLVPGERKAEGIVAEMPLRENFTLPFLSRYVRGGTISVPRQRQFAARWIDALGVRTTGPEQPIRGLSGGNQQKVCIGRWLVDDLNVLILDEPTRGVDLGARRDIYAHLRTLSDQGLTVIVISSDAEEIAGLADTATVLQKGRSVARFDGPVGAEALMHAAGSSKAA
ncbi:MULTISPECIES: sugar ABC transporter ATP-binding protein [unclassified Roseitalea]|uniref:sugar ABC transporter ATP-binding protein n=1 Tax=unclassified Roseitalea TaxID=2639107 RepID=UPI00273ECB63|nr:MULTISPECIES: sugar ABC transporter ATP-binding protein [unclassified Roseitalea]